MRPALSIALGVLISLLTSAARADEPIDFSSWEKERATVAHPCLTIKPADLARAKQNIQRYEWARQHAGNVEKSARKNVDRFTPQFIERMIEPTTPLSTHFTPCPACREQGKTWTPHGQWEWSIDRPDELKCKVCGTVFPNPKYPESITIKTTWGKPQTFTFFGGEPMTTFSYKAGRSSFTGCVRANKVQFMCDAAKQMGEAYLLGGDRRYAEATRRVLLRFAAVYPHWLVHSGYGEIADMDRRIAAERIVDLPQDERTYPPNKPDRQLHTGYWSAGRATGVGMEGRLIRHLAEAYDFTAASDVYSESDRMKIERDLLLEGTILLTADKQINNKSVHNRAGAAIVGIAVGHPPLVRFGIEGFDKTMESWFLPDGGTPESPGYAIMALSGVFDLATAVRNLPEPFEDVNLFHTPRFEKAWGALVNGLQGNLEFPSYADSRLNTRVDLAQLEIVMSQHPDHPQYLALLKEMCGPGVAMSPNWAAVYFRDPGLENKAAPALTLPDFCLPEQRIGHMRSGADGRESLLQLSASHWGAHHHRDSLNLSYWKLGHELLSDLGYLWDNPEKHKTVRTLAHNTVIIDGVDQRAQEREGDVKFFKTSEHVKAMRASSQAYENAKVYQRTSALIDHGGGCNYVVDFFTVQGGSTQDYVYHGPNNNLALRHAQPRTRDEKLYDLKNIRALDAGKRWCLDFTLDEKTTFTVWNLVAEDEKSLLGDGWGQRNPYNADQGATLPYVVRRTGGEGSHRFASVFESHPTQRPFVKSVTRFELSGGCGMVVETESSRDYIVSLDKPDERDILVGDRNLIIRGRLWIASTSGRKTNWVFSDEKRKQ